MADMIIAIKKDLYIMFAVASKNDIFLSNFYLNIDSTLLGDRYLLDIDLPIDILNHYQFNEY